MAITHSIKFTASAKDAISEIEKYEDKIVATAQTVDKYANSLGGSKILAQANNWTAAVAKLGGATDGLASKEQVLAGATKLTAAEQEKLNKTLEQAIAKYTALGKTAPTVMTDLYEATKKVPTAIDQAQTGAGGLMAKLGPLGPMIATTFSVGAVVGFAKELLATADATVKMADKTGMSIEAVQRLGFVAAQSGNTLEQVSGSVSMLQKRLAEGDKSAVAALNQLGLEHERFMAMAPDQQFMAVARAVGDIEDPMQRAKVATELFGRAGTELLPTLIANVDELAAKAPVMSERATKAFDDIGDSISRTASRLKVLVGEGLASALDAYGRLAKGVGQVLSGDFAKAADTLLDLETELPKVAASAKKLSVATTGVALSMDEADEIGKELTETAKTLGKAHSDTARDTKKSAEAFAALEDKLYEIEKVGAGATNEVWKFGRVIDEAGDTADTVKALDELAKKLYEIERIGANADFQPWKFGWEIDEAGDAEKMAEEIGKKAAESWRAGFQAIAKNFGGLMVDALTGSGNWRNAISALGSQVGELIGTKVGAALGKSIGGWLGKTFAAVLPGVGSLLGPVVDKFWGWVTKAEGRKVNDLRDQFISAAGGFDALNKKAHDAGMTLDQLLRADTVKEYEAAVVKLNAKLERTAQLQGELAGLQQQLADRQVMDWEKAQQLIEKYGGTLSDLGAKFTEAKQAADWKSLWDDWQTLLDMGADFSGVLVSMQDEISALVQKSLALGTEIPEQFKPLIEELVRAGRLLDENGDAITDLAGLKFGAPLVSEVDKIIAKIDELIKALTVGVGGAFDNLGRTRVPEIRIPVKYDLPDFPEPPDGRVPGYAQGTRGFVDFGAGTLAMLHGREAVVPYGQRGPVASPAPIIINLTSVLDGRAVAKNQVKYLPGELALAGL